MTNQTKTFKVYRREEQEREVKEIIAHLYLLLLIIGGILLLGLQKIH